jgi:hypothetical protein
LKARICRLRSLSEPPFLDRDARTARLGSQSQFSKPAKIAKPANAPQIVAKIMLVSRFRSSHHSAASS